MPRILLYTASSLLLSGCFVEKIEAIIAKYDTFAEETSTGPGDSSTTTGTDSTDDSGDAAGDSRSTSSGGASGTGTAGESSTAADTGGEETTGSPAAACGDGVQEGDEECDDGNKVEKDGCLSNCTREWLVFVSSDPPTQGDIGGVVGADYECRHRATKMFLPNGERYKAWISSSAVQAVDRLHHARGPYKLMNGLQVAANWEALVSGTLDNPINVTELSETSVGGVFTGTLPNGERVPNSTHCDDWTDGAGENFGWFGASTEVTSDWTYAAEVNCDAGANVICFEQP